MTIQQFVHEGLGNSSYLVERGNGRAVLVDPDRHVDRYLVAAERRDVLIDAVLETHLHADFVSGARELANRVDARLFLPWGAGVEFPHIPVGEDEPIDFDGIRVESLYTPGHTPEHLSYVLRRGSGPPVLFSGGSLIAGGAARTDLVAPDQTDGLTRQQYQSVHDRLAHLPDETLLYPTHGAGSFCSTGAGGERTSTLAQERATNPVLQEPSEEDFARWFPASFPAAPAYFFKLRPINRKGPRPVGEIPKPRPLSAAAFKEAMEEATVVDVRPMRGFMAGHIPGSLSNAFRDAFATWLGWLLPLDTPLLFVTDGTPIEDVVAESMLVGFEHFVGYLEGGIESWEAEGLTLEQHPLVDAGSAHDYVRDGAIPVDVRESSEFESGHLPGAVHAPLGEIERHLDRLPRERPLLLYCGHGERSASGLSLLASYGFKDLANLDGGTGAWNEAGLPLEHR